MKTVRTQENGSTYNAVSSYNATAAGKVYEKKVSEASKINHGNCIGIRGLPDTH